MGRKAIIRKIRSVQITGRQKVIGALALLATILVWVVGEYAGSIVVEFINSHIPQGRSILDVLDWGKDHPGQLSMIIFFLVSSYLIYQIILDTRTVKEIPVIIDFSSKRNKNGFIVITNHTGYDLLNCTIYVVNVDDAIIPNGQLLWNLTTKKIDIENGRSGYIYLSTLKKYLIIGKDENQKNIYSEKSRDIQLFFRGNTLKNDTRSINIWIPSSIKKEGMDDSGQIKYILIPGKIETAYPNFG